MGRPIVLSMNAVSRTIACGLVLVGLLVACTSAAAPTPSPTNTLQPTASTVAPTPRSTQLSTPTSNLRGSVRLWSTWDPASIATLSGLIEGFREENSGVAISVTYIPAEALRETLEAAFGSESAPTVFFAPSAWGPTFKARGVIRDIGELVSPELIEEIHPLAWSQVDYRGEVLGLPLQMEGNVLFRNRALVAQPAATLDDLVAAAKDLRTGLQVGAALDFGFPYSTPMSAACDGSLLVDQKTLAPSFGDRLGLCWLRMLKAFGESGMVFFNSDEDRALFEAGQAGWFIESTEILEQVRDAIGAGNLAVDPWPVYSETGKRLAGSVWTENAYFSTNAEEEDLVASVAFVSFLLSAESQLAFSDPQGPRMIPVRRSMEAPGFPEGRLRMALDEGVARPLSPDDGALVELLERAARGVTLQGIDPAAARDRALIELEDLQSTPTAEVR